MPREIRAQRLISRAVSDFRAAFIRQIGDLRRAVPLRDIEAALTAGRLDRILDRLDGAIVRMGEAWIDAHLRGAGAAARAARQTFDRLAPRAIDELRRQQLRVVNAMRASQRVAVLQALGLQRESSLREQARAIRDSFGLTDVQVRAVEAYRQSLSEGGTFSLTRTRRDRRFDAAVRRAVRRDEPLPPAQIRRMSDRYRDRLVAGRAAAIAEMEARGATFSGIQSALDQFGEDAQQAWVTQGDERVRGSHRPMMGQVRAYGEPFISGNGNRLMYPGDANAPVSETANCRCSLVTILSDDEDSPI